MSTALSYDKIAVRLHWCIAILIIGLLAGGLLMGYIPNDNTSLRFAVYNWHKTLGLLVLVLTLFRLYWRLTHKPPAQVDGVKAWEEKIAGLVHAIFYGFMIVMPLVGWAIISTSRFPSRLMNMFPLPKLPMLSGAENAKQLHQVFEKTHEVLAYLAIALIVLHVGAAIKHQLGGKPILARMIPAMQVKTNKDEV
ncbi:MAG: cytochrome B [Robiginitomaculum sp.]|nr:MAG: cytochrome B [Robiginitomaculum sp.]